MEEVGKTEKNEYLLQIADQLPQIADQLIEVGNAAMDVSAQFQDSQKKMQLSIGLTAEEAERLNGIAQNVFERGVADSLDVAVESVQLLRQNFKDLSEVQLEDLSNQLVGIVDSTGTDAQENINAAKQIMNAFGLSAEEALDVVATGFQNGLNENNNFLDSLNEISPKFSDAGYSASEMLAVLKAGLENGVFDVGKITDAIQELQTRFDNGSFAANIDSFSQATQDLFGQWQGGKATVQEVANSIAGDLQKMSPSEQQAALSALGSQFEDLGVDASIALLGVKDGLNVATDAAENFAEQTPAEKWEGSLRTLQDALIPIGESLLEVLNPVVDFLTRITDVFTAMPEPLQTFITVFGGVIAVIGTLVPMILAVSTAVNTLNISMAPAIAIIIGVAAVIAGIVLLVQNWGTITQWFGETWETVSIWCQETWENVKNWFNDLGNSITSKFREVGDWISAVWESIKNWFKDGAYSAQQSVQEMKNNVVGFFQNIIVGAEEKLGNIKTAVVNGFNGAVEWLTSLPQKAWQWGSDFIDGLVGGIQSMVGSVTSAVKGVADKISSFLHFSVPDEGPLVDAPNWMPDMIDLMTRGIHQNERKVEDAARSLAEKMRNSFVMNANLTNVGSGRTSYTFSAPVYLDGKKIADNTQRYITSEQRGLQRARGYA